MLTGENRIVNDFSFETPWKKSPVLVFFPGVL
jgi:hypothetical protein